MDYVKLIAPAKVNLVLAVGAKQPDGYHEVSTIMHALALHDTLFMRRLPEDEGGLNIQLTCQGTEGIEMDVPTDENLVVVAIKRLAEALQRTEDETIQIQLQKAIPLQAGLGGGSTDAAAALLGAAKLWDVPADDPRIEEVARQVGADVAFFLHGGCAYLNGRGDAFVHALTPRQGFCVLVRPDAGVSTKEAYGTFDQDPSYPSAELLQEVATAQDASEVTCYNNLASAAEVIEPQLLQTRIWLQNCDGVEDVVLCGSGSATLGICSSYDAAVAASREAKLEGWSTRVTSFAKLGAACVEAY